MSKYYDLPYFSNEDFPRTEYAKAAAMRTPIRDAINSARMMSEDKMSQVEEILEAALKHIRQGEPDADFKDEAPLELSAPIDPDDPLNILLGPSEAEPDTCIGG
jgi:hypothetical protein